MVVSYKLKKKELVFLLDLFGSINTLPQKFGEIYIDSNEHMAIAGKLHHKGMITLFEKDFSVDRGMEYIFKKIYDSDVVFSDNDYQQWFYCGGTFVVIISMSVLNSEEYIVTPLSDISQLTESLKESEKQGFIGYRGFEGESDKKDLMKFLTEYYV